MISACLLGQALAISDLGRDGIGERLKKVEEWMMREAMKKRWGVTDTDFKKHDNDLLVAFNVVCLHFDKSRQAVEREGPATEKAVYMDEDSDGSEPEESEDEDFSGSDDGGQGFKRDT